MLAVGVIGFLIYSHWSLVIGHWALGIGHWALVRKIPRFVGWVEARNPTNTLGLASLNPTYKKMAKVLLLRQIFQYYALASAEM
jgi:hypothetical protein